MLQVACDKCGRIDALQRLIATRDRDARVID
jgi:hypothetical protein